MARKSAPKPQRSDPRRKGQTSTDQVPRSDVRTAFDVFGSDLPDEAFAEIFDQPRQHGWRDPEL
jgi:hypothetical protein